MSTTEVVVATATRKVIVMSQLGNAATAYETSATTLGQLLAELNKHGVDISLERHGISIQWVNGGVGPMVVPHSEVILPQEDFYLGRWPRASKAGATLRDELYTKVKTWIAENKDLKTFFADGKVSYSSVSTARLAELVEQHERRNLSKKSSTPTQKAVPVVKKSGKAVKAEVETPKPAVSNDDRINRLEDMVGQIFTLLQGGGAQVVPPPSVESTPSTSEQDIKDIFKKMRNVVSSVFKIKD